MTSPMIDDQPLVGANGDIYWAPVGTPPPDLADWDDSVTPIPNWTKLGMISDDGLTWTPPEESTSDISIWQSSFPARVVTTALASSMGFALDEWNRDTLPFALGGGTFDELGDLVIFHPPKAGASVSRALFAKVLDGDVQMGIYFPKGRISGREDTVFKRDEAALLNLTFALEGSTTYEPYQLLFDPATFPSGGTATASTGARAGIPGSWMPPGSTAPNTLGLLQASGVVAYNSDGTTVSGVTPWTSGQYVTCANGVDDAHWDGSGWVADPA